MPEKGSAAEEELEQRISEFGQAWANSDVARLDDLLASHYLHTDATGRALSRDEWLQYAQAARPVTGIEFSDVRTKFYGDVAVVTGKNVIAGQPGSWDSNINIRFTQVWVKEEGEWRRAFFQATPIDDLPKD